MLNQLYMEWATRSLIVVTMFLATGVVITPDIFASTPDSPASIIFAAKLARLLSFATIWGAAVWALFTGGIIMFLTLPRHLFGNLRSKLFPVYFTLVSVCSAVLVATFAYLHPWRLALSIERNQLGYLLVSLCLHLYSLLFFLPMTIQMMKKRHKIERVLSIGEEVGWWKNAQVAKSNWYLAAANKKFGMIHSLSVLASIVSFVCLTMHSWYLAGKINM